MYLKRIRNFWKRLALLTSSLCCQNILAAPDMPWDDAFSVIEELLTGRFAHYIIIFAIAASGIALAIGDHGSFAHKAGKIVLGGSIAAGAVSICSALKLTGY